MKRVLVTGGCGFVGRHFVRRLIADGWQVTSVDDLSAGTPFAPPIFWRGDLREWTKHHPPEYDLIIHCAAVVGGRLKIEGDPLAVATDLAIDADFFNWVVKAETKPQVIYFSSSAVYPIELQSREKHCALAETLVNFENRIGLPDMTYGWAKLTGELLAQHAVKTYGANVLIYRPFSGYGEDQSPDYPFPSIIKRVTNKENPVTIWGSGEQCRDFIHIDDVVEAVLLTKDVLAPGEVLNLGTGVATSFIALADKASYVVSGRHPALSIDTTKPEGVFYRVADTYKLHGFYVPKITLEEGIVRMVRHLTKQKEQA